MKRCKIHNEGCFSRNIFTGVKVRALMRESGTPAEIVLSHGSCSDISAFYGFSLQIPSGSVIFADKEYDDHPFKETS